MKITINLTEQEMNTIKESVHGIAPIIDPDATIPEIFDERKINLKSIKINQNFENIEIDIDSEFASWFMENYFGLIKAILTPYMAYMEKMINEADGWIVNIDDDFDNTLKSAEDAIERSMS